MTAVSRAHFDFRDVTTSEYNLQHDSYSNEGYIQHLEEIMGCKPVNEKIWLRNLLKELDLKKVKNRMQ